MTNSAVHYIPDAAYWINPVPGVHREETAIGLAAATVNGLRLDAVGPSLPVVVLVPPGGGEVPIVLGSIDEFIVRLIELRDVAYRAVGIDPTPEED